VEEEHGCFRDCVRTQADYCNGVHVLYDRQQEIIRSSLNASRHAFSAKRAFAFVDSEGDLPNP
jgi:hypothetical protein